MGFKPVIPSVEAAPADTVEMTTSSDLLGTQAVIVELDDVEGEAFNAAPRDLAEIEPLYESIPDDSDLDSFLDGFALSLDADAPLYMDTFTTFSQRVMLAFKSTNHGSSTTPLS